MTLIWISVVILTLLLFWITGNLFTALLQDYFIFLPKKLPRSFTFNFTSPFEEIFIETTNRGQINALWFHAPESTAKKGLIIYNHGNKDNLKRWGHYHYYFRSLGYDFLTYDYRGFGKSNGPSNEKYLYQDALSVYDYALKYYPENKIIVYGRSMGSTFASKMAAENNPAGLILETPFSGMKDLFFAYYPFFPRIFWFKYTFDNKILLPEVSCPILIFQGTRDRIVPLSSAVRLKAFLKEEDKFIVLQNGNHHNLMHFEKYGMEVEKFLG